MSWAEYKKIIACHVVVIGKVSSLVGATVSITDGTSTLTAVFDSSLVVSFEVDGRKEYLVSAATFSKTIKPEAGAFVEVELGAFDRLWLVKDGVYDLNSIGVLLNTGDNTRVGADTINEFNIYGSKLWGAPRICSTKAIDVTEYSTLWWRNAQATFAVEGSHIFALVPTANGTATGGKAIWLNYACPSADTYIPLDISSFNGLYYFITLGYDGTNNRNSSIVDVFLTKENTKALVPKTSSSLIFSDGSLVVSDVYGSAYGYNMLFAQDTWMNAYTQSVWMSDDAEAWAKIIFNSAKKINMARLDCSYYYPLASVTLEASNDGTTWTTLGIVTGIATQKSVAMFIFENSNYYTQYRFYLRGRTGSVYGATGIQLYEFNNPELVYKDLN